MSQAYRCPNPNCTHIFAGESLIGVAAVTCPVCGGVFQLQPEVAAAPPAPKKRRRSGGWSSVITTILLLESFIVLLALLAYGGYRQMTGVGPNRGAEVFRSPTLNYKFELPGGDWGRDDPTQSALKATLLLSRQKPDVWVALTAKDFKNRQPPTAELIDEGQRQLRAFFRGLVTEPRPDAELAGQSATRFVFQGEANNTLMTGECLTLTHQGFGYWLACWCPADDVAHGQPQFAELQRRLGLLDQRPNWQPEKRSFAGPKGDYTLTDFSLIWDTPNSAPVDYDPQAELALEAKERVASPYPDKKALVLVLRLPVGEGKSRAEAAKAHLLERQKEVYADSALEDAPGTGAGDKGAPPNGQMLALVVSNTPQRKRFVLLGIVPTSDGAIVIQAECDANRRPNWEADFRQLSGSFALK